MQVNIWFMKQCPLILYKLMSRWRDVSAAFWLGEAQQTTWLISWVLTLWLMIRVLVAHLNVDHNLPAQGDIASFSFHWSGFFALALKNSSSQIHVTVIKKHSERGKHCQGTNYRFESRAHKHAGLGDVLIKRTYTQKQKIKILDFN